MIRIPNLRCIAQAAGSIDKKIGELSDMYSLLKSLKVDSWKLTNIEPIGRANKMADAYLTADDFKLLYDFICKHRQKPSALKIHCISKGN